MNLPTKTLLVLCIAGLLTLPSCASNRRSFRPLNPYSSVTLEYARKKNFSIIRTDMAMKGLQMGAPMYVRAFKSEMEMEVWAQNRYTGQYKLYKTYPICKKSGTLGPKQEEGDQQTPEGFYDVTYSRLNPNSKYYLSMNIGYPNTYDRALGRTGSALMIHGNCVSEGCLAMNDQNISEIYIMVEESLKHGQNAVPIHIFPFRMTDENMLVRQSSPWMPFWQNMKQGYDYFEQNRIPPAVGVSRKSYVFGDGTGT